jgi:hypothetical protein
MLRETLKQEIDQLSESHLRKIADFIVALKTHTQNIAQTWPFWKRATPKERAQDLRQWAAQLPTTDVSLPDEAFDRDSIYD